MSQSNVDNRSGTSRAITGISGRVYKSDTLMTIPDFDETEWVNYEFSLNQTDRDDFILNVVKPTVESVETRGALNWFHFIRSGNGVELRINADTDVQPIIKQHTSQSYQRTNDHSWYSGNDMTCGKFGARIMIRERERLSRLAFEVLEASRRGEEIDVPQFMARHVHISANGYGGYLEIDQHQQVSAFSLFQD